MYPIVKEIPEPFPDIFLQRGETISIAVRESLSSFKRFFA